MFPIFYWEKSDCVTIYSVRPYGKASPFLPGSLAAIRYTKDHVRNSMQQFQQIRPREDSTLKSDRFFWDSLFETGLATQALTRGKPVQMLSVLWEKHPGHVPGTTRVPMDNDKRQMWENK